MKKLLLVLLALCLAVPAFAAQAEEAPYEITVLMPSFYTETFQTEDNPVLNAIQEKAGVKLVVNFVPDATYPEAVSLALSGDMPMLLVAKGHQDPVIVSSARAGRVLGHHGCHRGHRIPEPRQPGGV